MPNKDVPVCTLLAGTNGSGKSSLYELLQPRGEFVNADVVAKQIQPQNPEAVSLQAGKRVLSRLGELIGAREDFVYETTLSGNQPTELIKVAKQNGYRADLAFIVLASVELNISRVAQRVAEGGHDIPEATIRRRFKSSFTRLGEALRLVDNAAVFENTTRYLQVLLRFEAGQVAENNLDSTVPTHLALDGVLADFIKK